jgi:hypothetical protein
MFGFDLADMEYFPAAFSDLRLKILDRNSDSILELSRATMQPFIAKRVLIPLDVTHHSGMILPTVPI